VLIRLLLGLLKGNPKQLGLQTLGVCVAIAWSWFFTWVILKILDCTMGLKVSESDEILGLDLAEHGAHIKIEI
jgi:Amt family ammonium transporter